MDKFKCGSFLFPDFCLKNEVLRVSALPENGFPPAVQIELNECLCYPVDAVTHWIIKGSSKAALRREEEQMFNTSLKTHTCCLQEVNHYYLICVIFALLSTELWLVICWPACMRWQREWLTEPRWKITNRFCQVPPQSTLGFHLCDILVPHERLLCWWMQHAK